MDNAPDFPLALYVHWPWCKAKCPYCDFNSRVPTGEHDHKQWADAYVKEMEHFVAISAKRPLSSIFFGGGTPSTMSPQTVGAVIEGAKRLWGFNNDIEITLEANPTSATKQLFADFKDAGINRVSIGAQSFNPAHLSFLGREHSADHAKSTIEDGAQVFSRVSFDLIYALPGQSPTQWEKELKSALDWAGGLNIGHISIYQLGIEPGTPFFRDGVKGAPEDDSVLMFDLTQQLTSEYGLPAYEISNHGRPEQISRHNMVYWQGGEYVGIGPGAHGRTGRGANRQAHYQIADPKSWLEKINHSGHGTAKSKSVPKADAIEERILTGLRIIGGVE
ncbi:MAG: radical SAM family heme chaperone HemW, partial [Rhodospirillaceae bacterium]|nr:radical SAM family heme chaperone HemW [Rhodospirillaceae bacterium]